MALILSLIIAILFSSSMFLMMHRSFFKLIVGVFLFGYATIFFLFVVSGVTENFPPLLSEENLGQMDKLADPLPQALTLTAIVIAIGVQIFVITLLKNVFESINSEDLDELRNTDRID